MSTEENKPTEESAWEQLWAAGITPGDYFDREHALPELVHQLSTESLPRGSRALVPGCGRGYAVEALVRSGRYASVTGLDISETAVAVASKYLSSRDLPDSHAVIAGDFFSGTAVQGVFDLVYDYTFFCAIPLDWRPLWAARMKELVKLGGVLVTVMFPYGKAREEGGPPHGVHENDYREILEGDGGFVARDGPRRVEDERAHSGRGDGATYWCVWERVEA